MVLSSLLVRPSSGWARLLPTARPVSPSRTPAASRRGLSQVSTALDGLFKFPHFPFTNGGGWIASCDLRWMQDPVVVVAVLTRPALRNHSTHRPTDCCAIVNP